MQTSVDCRPMWGYSRDIGGTSSLLASITSGHSAPLLQPKRLPRPAGVSPFVRRGTSPAAMEGNHQL